MIDFLVEAVKEVELYLLPVVSLVAGTILALGYIVSNANDRNISLIEKNITEDFVQIRQLVQAEVILQASKNFEPVKIEIENIEGSLEILELAIDSLMQSFDRDSEKSREFQKMSFDDLNYSLLVSKGETDSKINALINNLELIRNTLEIKYQAVKPKRVTSDAI
jgi:hypothetical protein